MFKRILKQQMMNRVLYSLIPVIIFAVYLFGWRVFASVVVANIAAFLTEYLFVMKKKPGKVSMAVFVTGTLIALSLPPTNIGRRHHDGKRLLIGRSFCVKSITIQPFLVDKRFIRFWIKGLCNRVNFYHLFNLSANYLTCRLII